MKKVNKNLIFYFAMAMALAVAGITSILARSSLVSLVMVLLGVDLMINGLVQLVRFFLAKMRRSGDFSVLIRAFLSMSASVFLIWYQEIPMWLMVVLFGAYMLLYGTAFLIQWWLYRQDGVKGRFLMFLMMIGFYVVGGIFLLSPSLTMDDMLILFGIYCLMLALTYFRDGLDALSSKTKSRMKRKVRFTMPAIICALVPAKALNDINEYLKDEDDYEIDDHKDEEKGDLDIYVHVTDSGFGLLGHMDIGFEGMILSYGNYDTDSYRLNSIIGDGVFYLAPEEATVETYLMVEKNNLFVYGLRLDEEQKAQIREAINRIVAQGYRWQTKIEREDGFSHPQDYESDFPSRLVCKTNARFYKFRDGRFKTYFALGSNCVLLADSVIGRLGTDILSMRGIISPGTYHGLSGKRVSQERQHGRLAAFLSLSERKKEKRVFRASLMNGICRFFCVPDKRKTGGCLLTFRWRLSSSGFSEHGR